LPAAAFLFAFRSGRAAALSAFFRPSALLGAAFFRPSALLGAAFFVFPLSWIFFAKLLDNIPSCRYNNYRSGGQPSADTP
jgi:hypothetical protein